MGAGLASAFRRADAPSVPGLGVRVRPLVLASQDLLLLWDPPTFCLLCRSGLVLLQAALGLAVL